MSGPPLHVHEADEEAVHVIQGTLHLRCGTQKFDAPAGTSVTTPRGLVHAWQNFSDALTRALTAFTPGRMERLFEAMEERPLPEVDRLAARSDTFILGPPIGFDRGGCVPLFYCSRILTDPPPTAFPEKGWPRHGLRVAPMVLLNQIGEMSRGTSCRVGRQRIPRLWLAHRTVGGSVGLKHDLFGTRPWPLIALPKKGLSTSDIRPADPEHAEKIGLTTDRCSI
jgi:hypothetical protein